MATGGMHINALKQQPTFLLFWDLEKQMPQREVVWRVAEQWCTEQQHSKQQVCRTAAVLDCFSLLKNSEFAVCSKD